MKLFLKIVGIIFVVLGALIIYCGYLDFRGNGNIELVILFSSFSLLMIGVGFGLVMLKKLALYVAPLVSILGIYYSLKCAIFPFTFPLLLIFVAIIICSVTYLFQSRTRKGRQ